MTEIKLRVLALAAVTETLNTLDAAASLVKKHKLAAESLSKIEERAFCITLNTLRHIFAGEQEEAFALSREIRAMRKPAPISTVEPLKPKRTRKRKDLLEKIGVLTVGGEGTVIVE